MAVSEEVAGGRGEGLVPGQTGVGRGRLGRHS